MTLHHLELSQEQPAPRSGFEPLLPGVGHDATPPGIIPGTAGSPPGLSRYIPGISQERNTTWNKSPCRRQEVAHLLSCPPFHFSSTFEEYCTATAGIGSISKEKGPGISKDTTTPPRPVCEYKTFAACS